MLQCIFWILSIITYIVLLASVTYNLVSQIKNDKLFRETNKRHLEYIKNQIEKGEK